MRAQPSFIGYQIFVALVSPSSACNSEDTMTLLLHYQLLLSGDYSLMWSHILFVQSVSLCGLLAMQGLSEQTKYMIKIL